MKSEQNINYIKQRQQMREQKAVSQNKIYKQIKTQYDDMNDIREQQN